MKDGIIQKTKNLIFIKIFTAYFCQTAPSPDPKSGLRIMGNGSTVPYGGFINYSCSHFMRLDTDYNSDTFSLPCLESNLGSFPTNIQWPTCITGKCV